jgi:LL-diaminopimelate aminotransferase
MKRTFSAALSSRLEGLAPYPFAVIDRMKADAIKKGVDLINLSIGDPDLPTPRIIVEEMKHAVEKPEHHRYPSYEGMFSFREAVAQWYKRRFNVTLDPETEVLSLIGSKEGIGHIPLAFVNPGDIVLCPSPSYPVYSVATIFADGEPYSIPLLEENNYLPDLKSIPDAMKEKAKMLFINYPNNPTAALATEEFFKEVIELAYTYNIIICHDAAYTEMYFDDVRPLSFLQVEGAQEVGIEFHSLSKTYNMTGWRIACASGNKKIIEGLGKIKTNIDSGIFQAIQEAGVKALSLSDSELSTVRQTYQDRRDVLYKGLTDIGLHPTKPEATFYLWTKVPHGEDSVSFIKKMLNVGVLATPGSGFGFYGEGYVRFALTASVERIEEAVKRLKAL